MTCLFGFGLAKTVCGRCKVITICMLRVFCFLSVSPKISWGYLAVLKKNSTFAYIIQMYREMTVERTRAKLVDVARQLFAKKGVEETTMNDIAVASKKGRRTLYTYFKSKEQIYLAVVESELEMLSDRMKEAAGKSVSPDVKIMELIMTHLDTIKFVVYRNGTLRASFFRDIWRVETVRKEFDRKEIVLFREVLRDGKEKGYFDLDNVEIMADILHYCVKGIEVPYIRGQIGEELEDDIGWKYVSKIVLGALGCKTKKEV